MKEIKVLLNKSRKSLSYLNTIRSDISGSDLDQELPYTSLLYRERNPLLTCAILPIQQAMAKRWRGVRYRRWDLACVKQERIELPPTEKELVELMERIGTIVKPSATDDGRRCLLCHISGDARGDGPGR